MLIVEMDVEEVMSDGSEFVGVWMREVRNVEGSRRGDRVR
jgi:hypothetical protein